MSRPPLDDVRVVVTRARLQAASLVEELEAAGAVAIPVPVIEIVDPPDGGAALRAGVERLGPGDWLVITSPNGASRVEAALDGRLADGVCVAAIGPGTRRRAEALGLPVDLVPDDSVAEGLLDVLPPPPHRGATMLLARAETARSVLPEGLEERGWTVHDVAAYRTVAVPVEPDDATACRHADVVAFTSASTVRHLVSAVGAENLPPVVACIGPATAAEAEDAGLSVDICAGEHTIPGLVEAIATAVPEMILLRPEPAAAPDSQWMLDQYFAEIDRRFETGLDRNRVHTTDPEEISPPRGLFLAARLDGRPVGCGALKVVDPEVVDIKRMWVGDAARGRGLGRRILRRLLAEARALGFRGVRLDTNASLGEAIALYRSEGFAEVAPFNDEPHADLWFRLDFA